MSDIKWTDKTWNPVIGCTRVSEGCRHCYAERMSARLSANPKAPDYDEIAEFDDDKGPRWTGKVKTLPRKLSDPLSWRKPRRVFVNSMSDLFHPDVGFEFIAAVWGVMASCPQHTFQVLTKRPERAVKFFEWIEDFHETEIAMSSLAANCWMWSIEMMARHDDDEAMGWCEEFYHGETDWPLPNVWLGTSVEHQEAADERIPWLLKCPAAVRFLSCEPLLGPVDLLRAGAMYQDSAGRGPSMWHWVVSEIDWVIAGGESGPGARPMHAQWVRSIRDQCSETDTPFFFKQWGAWKPATSDGEPPATHCVSQDGSLRDISSGSPDDCPVVRVGKGEAGRELDGEKYDEFPGVQP
ncbi:MAG: phage Gp37/Gp68 family protein [Trueperaceae bacterium]|nr:phage Gp37/Gp68 family protein [Trueperaceae bacterium]